MDNLISIYVGNVCDVSPFHFAKNEAIRLLQLIGQHFAKNVESQDIILDFSNVIGISSSGAQALVSGLTRRYGTTSLDRLVFTNVQENLIATIEDAVANLPGNIPGSVQKNS